MRLAGAGHRDVFEYGKDAALALRVALHTDGRQFKAFLEA